MGVPWELEWGEIKLSIDAVRERLENPRPVLREFSRRLSRRIRDNIKAGGTGWPPKAASTLAREQGTGTSQVTKRGTVRMNRIRRTAVQIKRLEARIRDEGWSDKHRKAFVRLKKRLENYEKAEARSQRKDVSERKIGARVSEKRELLQGIPGTIGNKIVGNRLITLSRANKIGAIHNDGEGHDPKREFIPPPNMDAALDELKELMESALGQAWETGKRR